MAVVNPYLSFNGDCEQAFDLYKSVFGGEYQGGGPCAGATTPIAPRCPPTRRARSCTSHSRSASTVLMGSDSPMGPVERGNAYNVAIGSNDLGETEKIFNGLAEGGTGHHAAAKNLLGRHLRNAHR